MTNMQNSENQERCYHFTDGQECSDLYNCCDCGIRNEDHGCGCRGCFSCNACKHCLETD